MLVNVTEKINGSVNFVNYTGKYPSLCDGDLIIDVNNVRYILKSKDIMNTGGACYFTNNYSESHIEENEWLVNYEKLPDELKSYACEIDRVINENIPFGCCGGCL